jgi:hypothetical protein
MNATMRPNLSSRGSICAASFSVGTTTAKLGESGSAGSHHSTEDALSSE